MVISLGADTAITLGEWAALVTILAFGAGLVEYFAKPVRRWRTRRAQRQAMMATQAEERLRTIESNSAEALAIARRIEGVLVTPEPTAWVPDPPMGLIDAVHLHGEMLTKMQPNGGTTNDPGDLLLRMARKMGVIE